MATTTGVARIVAALGTIIVLALASDEIDGSPRESETYALMLFATTGTLILAGADDLLVVTVGFLLASIPLYGLIGIARTPQAAEAAPKPSKLPIMRRRQPSCAASHPVKGVATAVATRLSVRTQAI